MSDFATIGLRVRLKVGDFDLPVARAQGVFALNTGPTAVLLIPAGRNMAEPSEISAIHAFIDSFERHQPATVTLEAIPGVTSSLVTTALEEFYGTPRVIFDGYVVGTGFERATNVIGYTVHMLHKLADLNDASAANPNTHPETVSQWSYPAGFVPTVDSGDTGGVASPEWVQMAAPEEVTDGDLADVWTSVLRKHALGVVALDYMLSPDLIGLLGVTAPVDADGLTERGARIRRTLETVTSAVPLTLRTAAEDTSVVKNAFVTAVRTSTLDSWLFTTLWGKMVGEWSPSYLIGFAPQTVGALAFPFVPALRDDYWVHLGTEDYDSGRIYSHMRQTLRAVAIPISGGSATGYDGNSKDLAVSRGTLAGRFAPERVTDGVVWVKAPPPWLRDFLQVADYGAPAAGTTTPTGSAMDDEDEPPIGDIPDPTAIMDSWRRMADRFAESVYVAESLKARTGELRTKLRFDIAPGSTIRFDAGPNLVDDSAPDTMVGPVTDPTTTPEPPIVDTTISKVPTDTTETTTEEPDRGTIATGGDRRTYVAFVTQVSYVIDTQAPSVGTMLSLAYVRTLAENAQPGSSTTGSPLYETVWPGGPLIPGLTRSD